MAITFNNAAFSTFGGGGTNTLNEPSGFSSTTIMIAPFIWEDTGGGSPTPAAGWTLVTGSRVTNAFGYLDCAVWWKVRGAGAASYTFSAAGSDGSVLGIFGYDGVDNTTPIDVSASTNTGTSTTATASAITTVTDLAQLLFICYDFAAAPSAPTGYSAARATFAFDPNFGAQTLFDKSLSPAGTSGTPSTTIATSQDWAVTMVALRPAGTPFPTDPLFFAAGTTS